MMSPTEVAAAWPMDVLLVRKRRYSQRRLELPLTMKYNGNDRD